VFSFLKKGAFYLLVKELEYRATPEIYAALRQLPLSFWLDSGRDHSSLGRYSILGADPFLTIKSLGQEIYLDRQGDCQVQIGNPWPVLRRELKRFSLPPVGDNLPCHGGAIGYLGYDLGRHLERIWPLNPADPSTPEMYLGFYDSVVVADHAAERLFLISTGLPGEGEAGQRRELERLAFFEEVLAAKAHLPLLTPGPRLNVRADFTPGEYQRGVEQIKEYIAAGDIFQANLTQRFTVPLVQDPWQLYLSLRQKSPAPFAAFLEFPEVQVLSSSPERFLKVQQGLVETRPIKGTRPRGATEKLDRLLAQELLQSAKDRAELTMIIDLERNDLGRVCRYGSVRVPELFRLEAYATVFHLVSTIAGELAPGRDLVDLLAASFPGGSITGAPKVRAMEIIEELEPVRRGIYTGAIGYLDFNGDADLNIVIRTLVIHHGRIDIQAGGGIVADSEPAAEYRETLDKARAMFQAVNADLGGESNASHA